ncbi:gamma-glutamyl-gamma-aminobutyrate hydrolase family protein [Pseudochrobactrum sp. sp1633]|uniref:gamma-glutamyl-gamma-aminobutyrate hydrolase family protein n=1 Tax=Pseudochrobactrum sp. sp1633 TaxID=3036706 RepID=UPI0025A55B7E|nr:gamma-glutamyl-gamma-aminobutyrate hydrolase family protein [Pseudochrobactrum sp. sp1633]MDM8345972.1 gamma-glutamyl-gamma-aminobutyrate hydrolase family protein [Pseudochrobactrum sp. sp1633]HWD12165.1 gamma-glutamyl-gamma-aminobutyrate hydrolase family protein [Pseudochrobactrum sp.]
MTQKSRPLIAVTSDIRDIDGNNWHATPSEYVTALVEAAGVTPVLVPNIREKVDFDALFAAVHGLLVTGSRSNVHPALYGQEASEQHGPFDPDRDATTLPLIRAALERGIPVLGICRGLQEMNVALGGSLANDIQELDGKNDHRAPISAIRDERYAITHPLEIAENSCLAAILESDTVKTNSVHRQAIDRLSDKLEPQAIAEDGTIEAVTVKDAPGFALAVQWHPEYWVRSDAPSAKIFHAFGDAVRKHAGINK